MVERGREEMTERDACERAILYERSILHEKDVRKKANRERGFSQGG